MRIQKVTAVASRQDTTRWEAPTLLEHMWGGQTSDGFVATGIMEIVYEESDSNEPHA